MPKISVVIPLYNKAAHIKRALDSVLAQKEADLEIIVVDDGSTDGGGDAVKGYADARIRYFRQENMGVSCARNAGIRLARAALISFLDADDEYLPGFIETILALRGKYPQAGVYSTAHLFVEANGRRTRPRYWALPRFPWEGLLPNYFESSLGSPPVCCSAAAVPRAVFESVGDFPAGEILGEDLDMWFRIALKYPVAFSSREGAVYHCEAQNRASNRKRALAGFKLEETAAAALARGAVAGESVRFVEGMIDKLLLVCAAHCIYAGQYPRAKQYLDRTRSGFFAGKKLARRLCLWIPYPVVGAIVSLRDKLREL